MTLLHNPQCSSQTAVPPLEVAPPPGCKALRFTAPRRRPMFNKRLSDAQKRRCPEIKLRQPFTGLPPPLPKRAADVMERVQTLELCTLIDDEAARLTSPDAPHCHIIDEVMDALFENFCTAPQRCAWNTPAPRPEWKDEFRLKSEWWVSMRILPCTVKPKEHYPPFIPWGMRSMQTENQFIADIALHMRQKAAVFSLVHLSHVTLTPERANVLLFDGILRNEARALECLSVPFCEVGAATLLLLLCGLNQCRALQPQLRYLNLSWNWIDASCSHMLAMLLGRTSVRRLSLHGNRFGGGDAITFQEFLLQGCAHLEELDLSYTSLTRAEVCALIRCLPQLRNLEVLLLDGVQVPESKAVALSSAIRQSKLTYVSLKGILACSGEAYLQRIRVACHRNLVSRNVQKDKSTMRHLAESLSFFEAFERRACNWVGDDASALPPSYRPFTTNEPSLPPIDEYA